MNKRSGIIMDKHSPEVMEKELYSKAYDLSEAHVKIKEAVSLYASAGCNGVDAPNFRSMFYDIVGNYFDNLAELLSNQHSGGTPAKIEIHKSFYKIYYDRNFFVNTSLSRDQKYPENKSVENAWEMLSEAEKSLSSSEIYQLLCKVINKIDFNAISESIENQISTLHAYGKRIISKGVCDFLNINSAYKVPRMKSRMMVFSVSSVDSSGLGSYRLTHEIEVISSYMNSIDEGLGKDFSYVASELSLAIGKLSFGGGGIPSRTVYGKGRGVEVVCFKEKYEFRFTREAFSTLQAFICLNGGDGEVERIMGVSGLLAKAA